jgi:Regulator of chromosome condensation (RCC1) repeat
VVRIMQRPGRWRTVLAAAGVAAVVGAGTAAPAVAAPAALQPPHDPGVFGFGNNDDGELGNGTTTNRALGHPIGLPVNVKQIAASDYMSAALLPDGTVRTWGARGPGQPASLVPVQVPGLTGITQIAVAGVSGDVHSALLR